MKGRRIPVGDTPIDPLHAVELPGDYWGPVMGYSGDQPAVFFRLPIEHDGLRHVVSPPHVFTEEPDGSLTITASILAKGWRGMPDVWHGYLTRGEWVEA